MVKRRPFYGRKEELRILREEFKKTVASLVVIRGRRRIGKSRLIEEFGSNLNVLHFSGLPPTSKTTDANQCLEFATQMSHALKMPLIRSEDWSELFWHLSRETSKGQWLVVLDEISWMGSKDPDFLGKLKNAWDLRFSKNPRLMMILCGSVSSWIEKNILSQTGFLGRISIDLVVTELPLSDCVHFWGKKQKKTATYDVFKTLCVTGGVPKYLEEIIPEKSAEENIQRLCFKPRGFLFREFDQIFSDLFSRRNEIYRKIVHHLSNSPQTLDQICRALKITKSGVISEYLLDLEEAGFIHADWTWNISNRKVSNLRKYRLSDNYLRFYLKYIDPHKTIILQKNNVSESLLALPNWSIIMGYQFENLVIANRLALYKSLNINSSDVFVANPFFQRKTKRNKGCQIDFLIQTLHRTLYLVEIKFSCSKIGFSVAEDVQEKLNRFSLPRGYSTRLVLVHVNGVTEAVENSKVFDFIVNFSEFLS